MISVAVANLSFQYFVNWPEICVSYCRLWYASIIFKQSA